MSALPVLTKERRSSDIPDTPGVDIEKSPAANKSPVQPDALGEDAGELQQGDAISDRTDIPGRYKWTAFCMILFFGFGRYVLSRSVLADECSSYYEGVFGPLKSTLVKQLKINSMSFKLATRGLADW